LWTSKLLRRTIQGKWHNGECKLGTKCKYLRKTSRYHQEEFSFKGGSTLVPLGSLSRVTFSPISRMRFLLRVVVCNIPDFSNFWKIKKFKILVLAIVRLD
jgi:hypothetical protein